MQVVSLPSDLTDAGAGTVALVAVVASSDSCGFTARSTELSPHPAAAAARTAVAARIGTFHADLLMTPPPVACCRSGCSGGDRPQRQELVCDVGGDQRRDLARAVVRRRDLDHVEAAEVDPGERADEAERLGTAEAADLGRPRARRVRGIERVDVEREVRRG